MTDQVINGTEELVECLDVLMAQVEFDQACVEHNELVEAFYQHYGNGPFLRSPEMRTEDQDEAAEEFYAQLDTLVRLSPRPDFEPVELETALWQTAQLTMTLLFDHMRLIDYLKGQEDKENVKRIITPPGAEQALIVP